ncbi:MAG: ComEC family competence protein [Alphaproteobacteria bacterium]|nr:ComEC family competence protein [Alphaproteobacteria bacterium]
MQGFAVGVLAGCAVYFSVPENVRGVFALLAIAVSALPLLRPSLASWLTAMIAVGYLTALLAAQSRVGSAGCNEDWQAGPQEVSGWIEMIDRSSSGRTRIYVRPDESVCRLRIVVRADAVRPGDYVQLRAQLFTPARAAVPGAYDSRLPLFFRRVALSGYAISRLEQGSPTGTAPETAALARSLARFRGQLSERIRNHLPERNGAIAAALLTGDRSHIEPEDAELLRRSGLGHILAISGLHMGLVAGGVFFAIRLLSAMLFPWSRRGNTIAPAAISGLLAGVLYLIVSGGAIPTQRAFIMTAALLLAALAGRRAFSMHTLALALIAVLIFQPESAVSPGFQMSFAAAGALIAMAEYLRERGGHAWFPRGPVSIASGLVVTSLIAGTATSAIAAFHFHRLAQYGLAANILAMPVFTFMVMPMGVLALIFMPFGLEALALAIMSAGLDFIFWSAAWVTSWPGSLTPIPSAPGWVLAIFISGYLLVLLGRKAVRLYGLAIVLGSMGLWACLPGPDVFISETGRMIVAQRSSGASATHTRWSASPGRRGAFAERVFLERYGQGEFSQPHCDPSGCGFELDGQILIWSRLAETLDEDCRRASLIVTPQTIEPWIARACDAEIIDGHALAAFGGHLLWLAEANRARGRTIARMVRVEDSARVPDRPWQ